eukprot:COSAG02_NODE_484_length_21389_cov_9.202583_9_plen_1163_part_00
MNKFDNPVATVSAASEVDNGGDNRKDDVEAGAGRIQEQLEKSVAAGIEKGVGKAALDVGIDYKKVAATLAKGGGFGRPAAQALLVINWMQNFSLITLLELKWPPWWRSLWSWLPVVFAFPFKLVVPIEVIFPSVEMDESAQYAVVLSIQPVLAAYTWYRASFFNGKSVVNCLKCMDGVLFEGAKEAWIKWDTGWHWGLTLVGWLTIWLAPPALHVANELSAFDDAGSYGSSDDETSYELPLFATVWLCFFSFVPFMLGYKSIIHSAYRVSQNRSEPDEVFFGQWARKEAQVLVFLVMTTHLSAVVACLKRYNTAADGAVQTLFLGVMYGVWAPTILVFLLREMHEKLSGVEEERDEAMDAVITDAEAKGDVSSFKAGLYATIRTFERRFWFFKPYMMLEKLPLAFFVLGMAGGEEDDAGSSPSSDSEGRIPAQATGSIAVVGFAAFVFIVARPFVSRAEDFTEGVSRFSNLIVLLIGTLVDREDITSSTGDTLLVAVSGGTVTSYIVAIGPVRALSELRAFITHRWAVAEAAELNLDAVKQMSVEQVAEISADVFYEMKPQQQVWMLTHQGEHLVEGVVPATLNLVDIREAVDFDHIFQTQQHVRTLCGFEEGIQTIDWSGRTFPGGGVALHVLAADVNARRATAGLNSLKCANHPGMAGDLWPDGTLKTPDVHADIFKQLIDGLKSSQVTEVDFSSCGIGPVALGQLSDWVREATAVVTSINCLANQFGEDDLATLLVAIEGTSVRSLCGQTEGQTVADFSGQNLGPIDVKIMAAEYGFQGFIAAVTSVNCLANKFGEDDLATLLTAIEGTSVRSLCGLTEGQTTADFSGQNLGPIDCKIIAAEFGFRGFIAALNSMTVDSTGVPKMTRGPRAAVEASGPRTYTLTTGEEKIDLSQKSLGSADVALVATWLQRPEVSAVVTSINCLANKFGEDDLATLVTAIEGTSIRSLCGLTEGQTTADFSGQNLGPIDMKIMAAEYGFQGFIAVLNSLKCGNNPGMVGERYSWGDLETPDAHAEVFKELTDELKTSQVTEADFSACGLGPVALMGPLSEWVREATAVLNSVTLDSTGVPKMTTGRVSTIEASGPRTYTLSVGEEKIDLSQKNLGYADVALLATWLQRPEVSATLTKVDVRENKEGLDKAAVDELRAAAPEACKILADY